MDNNKEQDIKKMKKRALWAVLLISVGMLAMFFGPPETVGHFFDLLKDVITSLII